MPAAVIEYPNIAESHVRATYEFVTGFFDGNPHTVGQKTISFPTLGIDNLIQDIRELVPLAAPPSGEPILRIGILNSSLSGQREEKCEDPLHVKKWAYEVRADLSREIVVAVPKKRSDAKFGFREAIRIWDMLFAIFSTQHKLLADRGMFRVMFEVLPMQIPDDEFSVVSGSFKCEVRAKYTRD